MYVPAHFAVSPDEAAARLHQVVVGELVTGTPAGPVATLLPLLHRPGQGLGSLAGHVARTNDHWRAQPVGLSLVIVRGPDHYVSPGWYPTKAEHGRVVPTWNYSTLHVRGELVVHDDPDWCDRLVRDLTARHEAGRAQPWSVDDAPAQFVAGQLRAVVGVELVVTEVIGKDKLSQNRPADADGVVAGLAADGDQVGAAAVQAARR